MLEHVLGGLVYLKYIRLYMVSGVGFLEKTIFGKEIYPADILEWQQHRYRYQKN